MRLFLPMNLLQTFSNITSYLHTQLKSYLGNEIKVFKKVERLEWKRTGARKKTCSPEFISSVIFMHVCGVCAAQTRMILLNNIIFVKLNQTCAFETQKRSLLRIEYLYLFY